MVDSSVPTLESTTLTAPDGGSVLLWHARPSDEVARPSGPPVVLVHGMFDTRRVWMGIGGGFVASLLARGLDPWIVERRTAPVGSGARVGLEEVLKHDLPLVQQTVFEATGRPAAWAGHSYGGALIARAMTTTIDPSKVWAAAFFASAVDPPLLVNPGPVNGIRLISLGGTIPSKALRFGPANETRTTMLDSIAWARRFRRGDRSDWSWDGLNIPTVGVVGTRDRVTPYRYCRRLWDAIGADPADLHRVGRGYDITRRCTHESVLVHGAVANDTAPLIADWLAARAPAPTPA